MGDSRIQVDRKNSSTLTRGFKTEESSFLKQRYQDQVEAETTSPTAEKQLSTSGQFTPTPPSSDLPPLGYSFEQMSVLPIQAKLTIGQPNDKYEQEADQVAEQVMRMPETGSPAAAITRPVINPLVQRVCSECQEELQRQSMEERNEIEAGEEEEILQPKPLVSRISPLIQRMDEQSEDDEEKLQTKPLICQFSPLIQRMSEPTEEEQEEEQIIRTKENPGQAPSVTSTLEARLNASKGSGQPLPEKTRSFMESRLGHDFSQVRVHADREAEQLNQKLNAQAFTRGQDVYFGAGRYNPELSAGKKLLAHELTHVVQQNGNQLQRKSVTNKAQEPETIEAKQITSNTTEKSFNKEQTKVLATEEQQTLEAKKLDSSTATITSEVATAKTPSAKVPATESQTTFTQPTDTTSSQMADMSEGGASEETASVTQETATLSAENPGQIIEQLKNTPPTQAAATYAQAQTISVQALDKQRQQVQATIPEIPAPTGLPAKQATESGQVTPKVAEEKEPAAGEIKDETSSEVEAKYETSVPEAPPPAPPSSTQLAGAEAVEEGQQDAALSRSAQNALENVQINTNQISTSAGERPGVDLSGEANPTQIETAQSQSSQEVSASKTKAAQAINQDFGENSIFPQPSKETLKANKELAAISPPEAKTGESPFIPAEAVGGLNQSLSPFLREKIGIEQEKYKAGKDKFDVDSAQAHTDANQEIANLNEETKQKQLAEQQQAKSDVAQYKQEWQSELDDVEKDYQDKAGEATREQRQKIADETVKGEEDAAKHLEDAEKQAESEKQKADEDAAQKKAEGKEESGGFWGWVKSKAKAFIDGIKKAVNFIYDNLRKAVKAIFEAAKKLALAAIELARKAIVGFIEAFGEILKGLVKVVFAAFPEIANRINAKIDNAVNKAVEVVNTAADALKTAVTAVLDFLANALDSLLKLIQDIYNGIFTVIGMIITGEFAELFKRIGNLIDAAKTAPSQFETAAYEELLGGNLDQPLSPAELAQAQAAGINLPGQEGSTTTAPVPESEQPTPPWTPENVGVDAVENNMELAPELVAELMRQTNGDGEVMLGESNDSSRSMESVLAEVSGDKQEGGETETQQYPDDGLTPRERAEIKWELMKQGISQWWSDNWPMVIGAGVLGVVGFIAANIVTGGAITAALPAIMSVVGPLFVGVTIATIAGHIRDYLAKGWSGDLQGGGKSLAKGLAAGAIELISWLTFKAGGAALKGAKALAKGAKAVGKAGVKLAKGAVRAVAKGAKYIIEKGKVLFKGIAGKGVGKQFKHLQDLGKGLLARMRFKAFRIRIKNRRFKLEGLINPWIILADGSIEQVSFKGQGRKKLGDIVEHGGENVVVVGIKDKGSKLVENLKTLLPDERLSKVLDSRGFKNLAQRMSGLDVSDVKDILQRTTPDALKAMDDISGKQVKELLDELGDNVVNTLGPSLKGQKLRELSKLEMFQGKFDPVKQALLDAGQGNAVKNLPSFKGTSKADIENILTSRGFSGPYPDPNPNYGMDAWTHADGSVVRIKHSGSALTAERPGPHIVKEISKNPGQYSPKDIFAKVADTGATVPAGPKFAKEQLKQWFKSVTGTDPSPQQLDALAKVWGDAGHADITIP